MGAFADPSTGLFHQAYLYTPFNITGRNAGAGATTANFVTWTDLTPDDPSFIRSGGKNDELAVFDGTVIPSGVDGLPTHLSPIYPFLGLYLISLAQKRKVSPFPTIAA